MKKQEQILEVIEEIDDELAMMESEYHGVLGDRITKMRCNFLDLKDYVKPSIKAREFNDEIRTVGDLKRVLKSIDNNIKVYLPMHGTVYDVGIEIRKENCREHTGKEWIAEGVMIEADG